MNASNHQSPAAAAAVAISYKKPPHSIVLPNPQEVAQQAVHQVMLNRVINKPARATVMLRLARAAKNGNEAEMPIRTFFNKDQIS